MRRAEFRKPVVTEASAIARNGRDRPSAVGIDFAPWRIIAAFEQLRDERVFLEFLQPRCGSRRDRVVESGDESKRHDFVFEP